MAPTAWQIAAPPEERTLSSEHLELLTTESGIGYAVVKQRGYYSPTARQIAQMVQLEIVEGSVLKADSWLSIPVVRPDGVTHGEIIRRFPSPDKMKYVWPTGSRNALDVHPAVKDLLADRSIPLIFTEGIKKSDALFTASIVEGIECVVIALNGCWGWRVRMEGGSTASPDFMDMPLEDRQCYLIVDSDSRSNDDVADGFGTLARYLESKTGKHRVFVTVVPPDGMAKQGADDYLVRGGTLDQLLGYATTPRQVLLYNEPEKRPLAVKSGLTVLAEATDRIPHLIEPLLPERAILVLAGHSGTFKTWHALGMMLDGAFGLPWLDHPELTTRDVGFTTLYINKEMGGVLLANRLKKLAQNQRYRARPDYDAILSSRVHLTDEAALDLASEIQRDRLEEAIVVEKIDHVVLDSLSMCWSGNEDSNSEVGVFYAQLRAITERTGCSWTIIHHLLKPNTSNKKLPAKFSVRGAGQIVQQADSAIIFSPFDEDQKADITQREVSIEFPKTRTDREPPPFVSAFSTNDGLYASVEFRSLLSAATASTYVTTRDPVKGISWITAAMGTMATLAPSSSGLRVPALTALLQAAWPSETGHAPPSERTIAAQLDKMIETGTLEMLDDSPRHGALLRFAYDGAHLALGGADPTSGPAGPSHRRALDAPDDGDDED